jgi:nucleotide-binding universal stress UspA family protein
MASSTLEGPVIVGVDGSENAMDAVRWATREAALRQVPLKIVAATPRFVPPPIVFAPVTPDYFLGLADSAQANLATATDIATDIAKDTPAGLTIVTEFFRGDPVHQLLRLSREAGLLVVGLRGSHHAPLGAIGSIPWALAGRSHCPVAVINENGHRVVTADTDPEATRTVAVGVDSSDQNRHVLDTAFREAALRDATLLAIHVWDFTTVDFAADPLRQLSWAGLEYGESAVLGEMLDRYRDDYPDVNVKQRVVDNRPSTGLIEAAADAELLIVGSRGRGTIASITLGSTGHHLLQSAPCPLLIMCENTAKQEAANQPAAAGARSR